MADVHTKTQHSYNMSRIRSTETKPEVIVRKYLFSRGLHYRKNDKRYHGKPDIVLPKYKTIVFVHGCFWHQHEGCRYAVMPSTNVDFWKKKLSANISRDISTKLLLESQGWNVITIWECELRKEKRENTLDTLYHSIINNR